MGFVVGLMENAMQHPGFQCLTLLAASASLLGSVGVASAEARAAELTIPATAQSESKNFRLRLERLEAAVSDLTSGPAPGTPPVSDIEQRLSALESDVGELQALSAPADVDVNCSTGGSINSVLASFASGQASLTIRITGTCQEAVAINRSNVALIGGASGRIQTPSTSYGVTVGAGAGNISVSDLTIAGGAGAVLVTKGAHAVVANVIAEESIHGMVSSENGALDVTGSILRNSRYGAQALSGGVLTISNSTIEGYTVAGVSALGGRIRLTTVLPSGADGSAGVLIRGDSSSTKGAVARAGGVIELSGARIESNKEGVLVYKASTLVFSDATNTITLNQYGVYCRSTTTSSYNLLAGSAGSITGNTFNNVAVCSSAD